MLIMALDPATQTGVAFGHHDEKPKVERVRLKRPHEDSETAAFNLACYLRDRWTFGAPDLVVLEHYMNPAGHKSADAAIIALAVHFTVTTMCMTRQIRWEAVYPATWRKHFIGQAHAGEKRARGSAPLTAAEAKAKRDATKAATLKRAKLLGYLPVDSQDTDKADAVGIWDYAAHTFGRRTPGHLTMFNQERNA